MGVQGDGLGAEGLTSASLECTLRLGRGDAYLKSPVILSCPKGTTPFLYPVESLKCVLISSPQSEQKTELAHLEAHWLFTKVNC